MRPLLLIPLCSLQLAACSTVTQEEEDILARVSTSSELDRDQLQDVMTICEAMLDCFASGCSKDTDIRRHMTRRPVSGWGEVMVMEFKNKGVTPMGKALKTFLKEESLHRADWPCRDFYHRSSEIPR